MNNMILKINNSKEIKTDFSLGRVAQLLGVPSHSLKAVGLIPSQYTYLGCWFIPVRAHTEGSINVSLT